MSDYRVGDRVRIRAPYVIVLAEYGIVVELSRKDDRHIRVAFEANINPLSSLAYTHWVRTDAIVEGSRLPTSREELLTSSNKSVRALGVRKSVKEN